ncbi:MAG: PEGA domain-containing protein [Myxococcota bacterium]
MRATGLAVLTILALGGGACQLVEKLRAVFHGVAEPPGPQGSSTLILEIDPGKNIEVFLDDALVAVRSPYQVETLAAGEHRLLVTSSGYFPFATPVQIEKDQRVKLMINLRRRAVKPKPRRQRPPPPAPEAPKAIGPPLPSGVDAITLKLATDPEQPIKVNGHDVVGRSTTLKRVSGFLRAGGLELGYRIGSSGLLELTVPDDDASWYRNGVELADKSFPLHRGSIRLERRAADGALQTLWLRR